MNEIWKDIEGYEGLYQVSNLGRIKSLPHFRNNGSGGYMQKSKILKYGRNRKNYLSINLCKNGVCKQFSVHRLVAQTFIPNPENKPEIDHIDANPLNNMVENLRWVTHKENMNNPLSRKKQSVSMQGKKYPQGKEHKQSKSILQLNKYGELIKKWDSVMDIEREMGLKHQNICHNALGKSSNCGGYKWGYVNDYERIPFKIFDLNIYKKMESVLDSIY